MKRILSPRTAALLLAIMLASMQAAVAQQKDAPRLKVTCDRADAIYRVGDTATFNIEALDDVKFTYVISKDGIGTLNKGTGKLSKGTPLGIGHKPKEPGFVQIRITAGKQQFIAAAAFDPTKIEPTAKMPDDFDAFWNAGKQKLAKVAIDAKLEHVAKQSDDRVDCYKISLANIEGKRVHGWLSVPKGKGPFPAVLTVPGAGVYGIGPDKGHAYLGALSMNIIIHDIPVDENKDFYAKQSAGALKDYRESAWTTKTRATTAPSFSAACVASTICTPATISTRRSWPSLVAVRAGR
jgi:cephalosporin-C deacetylase